jgi:hypothetical protein
LGYGRIGKGWCIKSLVEGAKRGELGTVHRTFSPASSCGLIRALSGVARQGRILSPIAHSDSVPRTNTGKARRAGREKIVGREKGSGVFVAQSLRLTVMAELSFAVPNPPPAACLPAPRVVSRPRQTTRFLPSNSS